jgi:hypothetical protein
MVWYDHGSAWFILFFKERVQDGAYFIDIKSQKYNKVSEYRPSTSLLSHKK